MHTSFWFSFHSDAQENDPDRPSRHPSLSVSLTSLPAPTPPLPSTSSGAKDRSTDVPEDAATTLETDVAEEEGGGDLLPDVDKYVTP